MPPDQPGQDHAPATERERDEKQAAGVIERFMARVDDVRSWVHRRPAGPRIWRIGIAVIGLIVIIVGVIFLAVPGPGWVTIFVGLGIWATEFAWAKSLLTSVQRTVGRATEWIRRQPRWLMALAVGVGLIAVAAVAVGIWLAST